MVEDLTPSRRATDALPAAETARGDGRDVILQAFHWNLVKTRGTGTIDGGKESWWRILLGLADRIADLGFTLVYLPPPWRDDSEWSKGDVHGGGEGYFWHDFDLDSRYGTKRELTELVAALAARGVRTIVDLVPNHRDRTRMKRDIWPYPGAAWADGGGDTGTRFLEGHFDLNLAEPLVHNRMRAALDELLNDCGVVGWRWDFVYGYAPEDVVTFLRETEKVEYFSMGEYWQGDPNRKDDPLIARYGRDERARIVGWARDARSCAFDTILKKQIQTATPRNLRDCLAASWRREDRRIAVTYVDNHDTGASPFCRANGWGQRHWPCPDHFKSSAYAFILTMPGTPCVYWPDVFDWGFDKEIAPLIAARRASGVTADSEWIDLCDLHDGFAGLVHDAEGMPALAVSIGSSYQGPPGFKVVHAKKGEWTVWAR